MGERWFSRRSENYPAPSLQLERKELEIYFRGLVSKAIYVFIHVLGIASKFFIDINILSTNLTKSDLGYCQIWFYDNIWMVFDQRISRLLVWKLDSGSFEKKGIMWPQPGVFYDVNSISTFFLGFLLKLGCETYIRWCHNDLMTS